MAYIVCLSSGLSRQEIVNLNIVKINKHKGTKAARTISANRYTLFDKMNINLDIIELQKTKKMMK